MTTASGPPRRETATQQEAGRTCPYCRFPLKAGIELVRCGVCHAPYHGDCWSDNGGCAVMGCSGAPAPSFQRPRDPEPPLPVGERVVMTAGAEGAAGATGGAGTTDGRGSNGRNGIAVAIAVLAVVVIALAVALSRGDGGSGGDGQLAGDGTEQVSGGSSGGQTEARASGGEREARIADDETTRQQIRQVIYRYHADILEDDYAGAWALMSHRKQRQKLKEDGYGGWQRAQATLKPYLDPEGVNVSIQALDRRTGIARVLVTGMSWSAPRANCSEWSGITWMKYEGGRWRYDPGYSTTAERERLWKPRDSELLGVSC